MFDNFDFPHILAIAAATAALYGIDPLVQYLYTENHKTDEKLKSFNDTVVHAASQSIATAARIHLLILLVDVFDVLEFLHFSMAADLRLAAIRVSFTVWAASSFCSIKHSFFLQAVAGARLGRVVLYDRLVDFVVYLVAAATIFDAFEMDVGVGMQSIMAGSGVGALAFSLASKDLASNIVGGLVIQAWEAFQVGDLILLGDGTEGTVTKVGLVETEVLGYDNITTMIPNSQLNQRVSNLSGVTKSQVKVFIRLKYADIDKAPKVLEDIKSEIKEACPKLISDGSSAFFALLSDFKPDHIEAVINTHYAMPLRSIEYLENKHEVFLAISRALKRNSVEVALPSVLHHS